MSDPGDEDDVTPDRVRNRHWLPHLWRLRRGKTLVLYAAERLPPMTNHDDGDEEPRLTRKTSLYQDLI